MSTFMNDSFSTVIWGWQLANQVIADGGDPVRHRPRCTRPWPAWARYHFLGRPPVDCAGAPEEYQSICYRDATYLQWNGSEYTTDTPLGTDVHRRHRADGEGGGEQPAPGELTNPCRIDVTRLCPSRVTSGP